MHIRELMATLLSEVASNVGVEPRLLPLSGEALPLRSANTDDQARLDIEAYGFWGSHNERALFVVRVFNPFARSRLHRSALRTDAMNGPKCGSMSSGCVRSSGPLSHRSSSRQPVAWPRERKKLSDLLAVQRKDNYSRTIALVRAMLNFSLLRDAIASLRGARSAKGRFDRFVTSVDVAVVESRVEV